MMKTTITKKVSPTNNGSATHPKLKLFLRRRTNVRTPKNNMDVAMKARMGETNHDRITGTIPCIAESNVEQRHIEGHGYKLITLQ